MFTEMRRKDREIFGEEIEKILFNGKYGTLSTIGDNGYPYVVPLSYVYYNKSIYFHCAKDGYKLQNIVQNDKVSFCVVTDIEVIPEKFSTKYNSVIAFGTASEVTGESKDIILLHLIDKYSHDYIDKGKTYIENTKDDTTIIKIDIQHITGKART
jgi:nitroimidazol reductase NimA-like FMN-containing flavoprotein (pyridoxamine 5'-phosphate oxidase superfamily)